MSDRRLRPGQRVRVATAFGARDAMIVTGRVSPAGNVKVALRYGDNPKHDWRCRQCFGAPRSFHVDDVRAEAR